MKHERIAGWVAAGILGLSIALGHSTASAEFVTIDDFSKTDEDYEPVVEVGGTRESGGVAFSSSDGLTAFGPPDGFGSFLFYGDITPNGLKALLLKGVINGESGGDASVTAFFYFGPGFYDYTSVSHVVSKQDDPRDLEFTYTGADEVTDFEVRFTSEHSYSLTSSSLDADFEPTGSSESPQATPEPTSLVLFGLASAGGGIAAWRKRRRNVAEVAKTFEDEM